MFPALSLHALQNKLRGFFNHIEWLPWLQQAKELDRSWGIDFRPSEIVSSAVLG